MVDSEANFFDYFFFNQKQEVKIFNT